jgi:5-methylcytosine-specific restriction endonuclease McrA
MATVQPSETTATPQRPTGRAHDDSAAYKRWWRARRKASGVCTACGGTRDVSGKVRCAACQAKDKADYERIGRGRYKNRAAGVNGRDAEQRRQWGVAGLCTWCGGERDDEPRVRCRACNDYSRRKLRQYAGGRRGSGLCPKCGGQKPINRVTCRKCCDKSKEYYKVAYARDPQRVNSRRDRRRYRLQENGGTLTAAEWQAIKAAQGYTCLKCGRREPDITLTVDHVISLVKGGPNTAANVQGLCDSCNKSKGRRCTDYRTHQLINS